MINKVLRRDLMSGWLTLLIIVILATIEFFVWAGVVAIMAWAFEFTFSWSYAVGVWLGIVIINNVLKR